MVLEPARRRQVEYPLRVLLRHLGSGVDDLHVGPQAELQPGRAHVVGQPFHVRKAGRLGPPGAAARGGRAPHAPGAGRIGEPALDHVVLDTDLGVGAGVGQALLGVGQIGRADVAARRRLDQRHRRAVGQVGYPLAEEAAQAVAAVVDRSGVEAEQRTRRDEELAR